MYKFNYRIHVAHFSERSPLGVLSGLGPPSGAEGLGFDPARFPLPLQVFLRFYLLAGLLSISLIFARAISVHSHFIRTKLPITRYLFSFQIEFSALEYQLGLQTSFLDFILIYFHKIIKILFQKIQNTRSQFCFP